MLSQKSIEGIESNNYCIGTVNCTVDHAQYADSVKKSISELPRTAVCRLQNKVQCLYNFRLTQSINYFISAHYAHFLRLYEAHFVVMYIITCKYKLCKRRKYVFVRGESMTEPEDSWIMYI